MAFIPTEDVARVSINQLLFGQQVVNTLWFNKVSLGVIDAPDLAQLGQDVGDWWVLQLAPILSTNISLVSVTATSQNSLIAPSVETIFNEPALAVGAALPGNVCITVKFNTVYRGRSGRGRNYVGGLREADVTGNLLDADVAAELIMAYNALVSAPPSGWNWVLVSHYSENEPRTEGLIMDIISTSIVDLALDSQRRRLTNRGN